MDLTLLLWLPIICILAADFRMIKIRRIRSEVLDEIFDRDDWKEKYDYYQKNFSKSKMFFNLKKWTYQDFFGDINKWGKQK